MRFGVIGLGAIAPYFLWAIEADPACTLAAVCDLDPDRLAPYVERGVAAFHDHRELLADAAVDAVVVTVPNDRHGAVAVDALDRGVAVCCEKPLTITAGEAAAVVAASRRGGAVLFTAFHRRYNRHLRELAAALPPDRGAISGVLVRYHENIGEHCGDDRGADDHGAGDHGAGDHGGGEHGGGERWYLQPRRCGGGCLIDNGPNALDAVRLLVGDLKVVDATIGDVRAGAEFCAEADLVSTEHGVPVRVELDWALPTGEIKDVLVRLRDGRELRADLLAGFDGFKSSLEHEYRGVLADFTSAVATVDDGAEYRDPGPRLVDLVADAYAIARGKEQRLRMIAKPPVAATVVKLLFHTRADRGMTLSPWQSRCVPAGQVHELVTTTDRPRVAGDRVDRVGFLGFAAFDAPAVLERGDRVWLVPRSPVGDTARRQLGTIAGFDESHWPNHYNLVIDTDELLTAGDVDLRPGDKIFVEPRP
jgi:predicted dehydrogenase